MKYLVLLIGLFIFSSSFAQRKLNGYVELRGSVDALGNIYLDPVSAPKKRDTRIDSLIDYKAINFLIGKYREPVKTINALSELGWELISTTHITSDKESRPNTPFILYYLKQEFIISSSKP